MNEGSQNSTKRKSFFLIKLIPVCTIKFGFCKQRKKSRHLIEIIRKKNCHTILFGVYELWNSHLLVNIAQTKVCLLLSNMCKCYQLCAIYFRWPFLGFDQMVLMFFCSICEKKDLGHNLLLQIFYFVFDGIPLFRNPLFS